MRTEFVNFYNHEKPLRGCNRFGCKRSRDIGGERSRDKGGMRNRDIGGTKSRDVGERRKGIGGGDMRLGRIGGEREAETLEVREKQGHWR
jgi:hypothetical protein